MIKILFVYPAARKKNGPSTHFYGLKELKRFGFQAFYSDIAFSRWNLLYWLFFPAENWIARKLGLGFKLNQAILLLKKAQNADLIITTSDSSGLPFCLLKFLGILKTPLFYISIGLTGQYRLCGPHWLFNIYKKLLKSADRIICYSIVEMADLVKIFNVEKEKLIYCPIGVDTNFYTPSSDPGRYILSVGRDLGRDYALLVRAAGQLPRFPFKLVCSLQNISGLKIPPNMSVELDINYTKLRQRYRHAKFVVLPLRETQRASGQTVLLEAMACGKTVIVSGVRGLSEVYDLKSGDNCVFVPVNNVRALVGQLKRYWFSKKEIQAIGVRARRLVKQKYSQLAYARVLADEITKFSSKTR